MPAPAPTILCSESAAVRLEVAREFIASVPAAGECAVVAESRDAADDFTRAILQRDGARFGLRRYGMRQLTVELANADLARRGGAAGGGGRGGGGGG
ncbi:MAG: hypothetical protein F4Y57_12360, partial [Acidobacteria bacterium]|nr:hypothetical protein [Acidobacteriota bacterium]